MEVAITGLKKPQPNLQCLLYRNRLQYRFCVGHAPSFEQWLLQPRRTPVGVHMDFIWTEFSYAGHVDHEVVRKR